MKNILTLFIILLVVTGCKTDKKTSQKETFKEESQKHHIDNKNESLNTTYYLIRHAEKDLSDPANRNPDLTKEGEARAIQWKDFFKDKNIDAVYSTNYIRTMRTAEPTAKANNLEIINYNPSALNDSTFVKETAGKNVVVVGHSNTTPNFANAILKTQEAPEIDESDYGNVYIVTLKGDQATFTSQHFD